MYGFKGFSSVFDDTINSLFGTDFENLFDPENVQKYVRTERTATKDGHVYKKVVKNTPDGYRHEAYYKDGKKLESVDKDIEKLLNSVSEKQIPYGAELYCNTNNRLNNAMISGTELPYTNIACCENGELQLEFAIAGIDQSRISISFENDYLLVSIDAKENKDIKPTKVYIQKGIKNTDNAFYKRIFIDPKKYDINTLEYEVIDGILNIYIKVKKVVEPTTRFFLQSNKEKAIKNL